MKNYILCLLGAAALTLPAVAQPNNTYNANNNENNNVNYNNNSNSWNSPPDQRGPHKGSSEFTLGGNGSSDKRMSNSLGGISFSLGSYFTDTTEVLLRQSVDYSNPSGARQAWDGSTKLALDQHVLANGAWRPFVGANFGGIYGKRVHDTWAAGLEAGLKYYTLPRTFIFADVEYDWFFRHAAHALGSKFNDGEWNWNLGLGFNL
ncbi:MAG TPA: hypothetical protein VFB27_05455 [Opitutaceae bacterium]|nr:hypothetical protein [Opitutaceae bacterium]